VSETVTEPAKPEDEVKGFIVASNIEQPQETERFQRLEALLEMRRLYRSIASAERLCGKGKRSGEKEGSRVEQMVSQLEVCKPRKSKQLTDDEILCNASTQLDAVQLIDKIMSSRKRMEYLHRDMEEKGCYERLWGGKDHEVVRQTLEERIKQTCSLLDNNMNMILKMLPGNTLEEARKSAEEVLELEASQREGRVSEAVERVNTTIRSSVRKAEEEIDKIRETPVEAVADFGKYARGVWTRLNGGEGESQALVTDLPRPQLMRKDREQNQLELTLEVAERDKAFKEASRDRETRLRKEGVLDRARLAGELREMDMRVDTLRRALVVNTLELQMEFVHGCLEEEAAEVMEGGSFRDREVELFVAEFGSLDARLAQLTQAVDNEEAIVIDDEYLAVLATDVPDLKTRLGILDDPTAPVMEVSTQRLRRSLGEGRQKLVEGLAYITRSVRLLMGDTWYSLALIGRAIQGNSLKSREVLALRRTSRDLLTFPLFAAILIAPISPVGHVLVFSFMQQYFPGLFPSQFSSRRQELLQRYEELTKELREAEQQWMDDSEKGALIAAEAAVAALLKSESPGLSEVDDAGRRAVSELRQKFKSARGSVNEYTIDEELNESNESESLKK